MTFVINQIIFPTDFSENTHYALPFAAEIAKESGAELILFHSSQTISDLAPGFEINQKQTIEDTSRYFDELISELRKDNRYSDIEISTMLQAGQPSTSLLNQIATNEPGLVVMGTRGESDNRNILFGTVTTHIIQKSAVPVLAVPDGTAPKFESIVFTSDLKQGDIAALKQTLDFAKLFNSSVDVLHVGNQNDFENEIKFRGFRDLSESRFQYEKLDFHLKHEKDFFPAVADFISQRSASLIVTVRYEKSFWEKLTDRDHSREMAFYSDIPLLMLIGDQKSYKSSFSEQSDKHKS